MIFWNYIRNHTKQTESQFESVTEWDEDTKYDEMNNVFRLYFMLILSQGQNQVQ